MTHELEVGNLGSVKEPIPACAPAGNLDKSQFLVKPDGIHTDAGQFRSFADVDWPSHPMNRINLGVRSRVKRESEMPSNL